MPGTYCAVAFCNSNSKQAKTGKKIIFHRFPKNKEFLKIWIKKCNRAGKWNTKTSYVCSEHFTDNDYERDLKGELLNLPLKKKLKPAAIPSVNISGHTHKKSQMKLNSSCELMKNKATKNITSNENNLVLINHSTEFNQLETEYTNLKNFNNDLKKKVEDKNQLISKYKMKIMSLEKQLASVKTDLVEEKSCIHQIEDSLKQFFSKPQVDIIFGKKKVTWSSADISNAFAIMHFSKDCFVYLREKLKFPLPSLKSLQRWASQINSQNEILEENMYLSD